MAKNARPHNKIDLINLSDRDRDLLTLDVQQSMKKYKIEKQGVYDRRFALNKKMKEAGLTVDDVLNGNTSAKKGKPKKEKGGEEPVVESRGLMVMNDKQVPVIMKPIEINFETFSVKLNGVPKRISVNPETNAIEIDI